jgi:enoyl-CoA hydratase/carnithine racemase
MTDTILVNEADGVGVITRNRPAVRNALNTAMRAARAKGLAAQLPREARRLGACRRTAGFAEGAAPFRERRSARSKGV